MKINSKKDKSNNNRFIVPNRFQLYYKTGSEGYMIKHLLGTEYKAKSNYHHKRKPEYLTIYTLKDISETLH